MITDKEIAESVENKLNCAIKKALADGIPLSRNIEYRARIKYHGFVNAYWDYRRNVAGAVRYTYALDMIIIDTEVKYEHQQYDAARVLRLSNIYMFEAIDKGFQGYEYSDVAIGRTALSKLLFNAGASVRRNHDSLSR